jgi:multiple sugar transport system substrate-binding protein
MQAHTNHYNTKEEIQLITRRLLVIVLSIMIMAAIAACTNGAAGSNKGKEEIVWWYKAKEQQQALDKIAAEFNKSHTNIHVKAQLQAADYFTKLQTVLATNNGPDVFWMNGKVFNFQTLGYLKPLSEFIKRDNFDLTNYPKPLVDSYTIDGQLYAINKDFDTIGLYYNKEMFDKAKVPYPDNTWTWETLRDAAKKLTVNQGGKTTQWGIIDWNDNQEVQYPALVQNGVNIISPDQKSSDVGSPAAIEAIQFLYDLMYVDKSSPDGKYMTENDPEALFQSGKGAMIADGSWMAAPFYASLKDKLGVAVLPMHKKTGNVVNGIGWSMNAKTKHADAAWEFLKYLGSKDAALIQADSGTVIPAFNGTQDNWVKSIPSMNLQIFIDQMKDAVPVPNYKNPQWAEPLNTHFGNIWLNKEKPEQAMKQAQTELNAILSAK